MNLGWSGSRNSAVVTLGLLLLMGVALQAQPRGSEASLRARIGDFAADGGGAEALERRLQQFRREAVADFRAGDYDYLLARLLERRGKSDEATILYREVVARRSLLAGHALRREAGLARQAGRVADEQRLLEQLLTGYPDFIDREALVARLTESLLRAGSFEAALEVLRRHGRPRRDNLLRLAEAQAGMGWRENARATFEAVLSGSTTDEVSLRAARGLDRLAARDPASLTILAENARLQRARLYQFNRSFDEARHHWRALLRDFPASPHRVEALFQLGRGYFLENNFRAAIEWYDRVATESPQTLEGEQGFYQVGHCYQGLDETSRAISRYELFLRQYPQSRLIGYAHLNAIDTLRSAGRLDEALRWTDRLRTGLTDPFMQVTGLFNRVRIHLSRSHYAAALAGLDSLREMNLNKQGVQGLSATTNAAEVEFLRGYCLEKLGRNEEALAVYLSLPESRSGAAGYYGRRATVRLRGLAQGVAARLPRESLLSAARQARDRQEPAPAKLAASQALRFPLDAPREEEMRAILAWSYGRLRGYQLPPLNLTDPARSGDDSPHARLAARLIALGLEDEGGPELAATDAPPVTIAWYCARSECAALTLRYSEPILNGLPADYQPDLLPREWQRLFYPTPWREELEHLAATRAIDPLLLLSIARQESRFQTRAASAAAARGPLQFIAPTALAMARELRLTDFELDDLFIPAISLQLGAQYLRHLQARFNFPPLVAAAYNGSEESVARWIARANSRDIDRHVIEILKRETKDYVFKVDGYHQAYRVIRQDLRPPARSTSPAR